MRSTLIRSGLAGLALAGAMALATAAIAETITMKADLKASSGGKGAGNAVVTYDTTAKKVTWKLNYSDLTGAATAAHFHGPAEVGKNAGVAVPIANPASGTEGSATLTDAQAADLLAGRYYINIHTAANPAGEIRGQVTK